MTSKLASLHSGLVARKGEAMPAVSHALFSYVDTPRTAHREEMAAQQRVWPKVATPRFVEEKTEPTPLPSIKVSRPSVVAAPAIAHVAPTPELRPAPVTAHPASFAVAPKTRISEPEADNPTRHRFTFRLTSEQHHRLRLAAAIRDESLQHLLSQALDNHLDGLCACSLKDCACLAAAEAARS